MKDQPELEGRLVSFLEQNRLPGGVAGVVCGDELTWLAGAGFADLAAGTATDPATGNGGGDHPADALA